MYDGRLPGDSLLPVLARNATRQPQIVGTTHISLKSLHKTLNSRPCSPFVKRRVGKPRPNSARIPSAATISFAAVPALVSSHRIGYVFELTVSDVLLVHLSICLYDSQTVAHGVRNDGSCKADEGLPLSRISQVQTYSVVRTYE
jgi:hypothetical protein